MTCVLDPAIRVGQVRIAVVSQTRVVPQDSRNAAWFTAGKKPLFVLMERNEKVSVFDLSGHKIPLADIEALCPGLCASFIAVDGAS